MWVLQKWEPPQPISMALLFMDLLLISKILQINRFNYIESDLITVEESIVQIIEPKTSNKNSTIRIIKVVYGFENHYADILSSKGKIQILFNLRLYVVI
jgi:hypothetical protein